MKTFVLDLRFDHRGADRKALREVEAVAGLTIVRGRITASGARLEVRRNKS